MYTNGNLNGLNGHKHIVPTVAATRPIVCRGVRGAITASENTPQAILEATRELLHTIMQANDMDLDDIASVYFTTTMDLDAAYPAQGARELGWYDVALLCGHEMNVPGSLPRCIRVLIHWNTTRQPKEIVHVYLRDAKVLRPDRSDRSIVRPIQVSELEAVMRVFERSLQ